MRQNRWARWADQFGWLVAVVAGLIIAVGLLTGAPQSADRVEQIASRLRCPVCQTVSVAESPSESARAMREIITEQVADGRSDEEIITYFIAAYGEWVVIEPPARGGTLALWLLPPAAFLVGLLVATGRRRHGGRLRREKPRQSGPFRRSGR